MGIPLQFEYLIKKSKKALQSLNDMHFNLSKAVNSDLNARLNLARRVIAKFL